MKVNEQLRIGNGSMKRHIHSGCTAVGGKSFSWEGELRWENFSTSEAARYFLSGRAASSLVLR
jgi:hypothetical protein